MPLADPRKVKLVNDREPVTRKLPGAVPHDAGGPAEDPWLQLNAYEPIEGLAMMESQHLLFTTSQAFRTKCVDGITVNEQVLARYMETTVGIVTALNPVLGYDRATELANEAYKSGKGILEIIRERQILTEAQIADLLDPAKLTMLDKSKYPSRR